MKYKCKDIISLGDGWNKMYYIGGLGGLKKADIIKLLYGDLLKTTNVIEDGVDEKGKYIICSIENMQDIEEFDLLFSPQESITGALDIIDLYGYWPTFHDDRLIEVHMKRNSIKAMIEMQTKPDYLDTYPKIIFHLINIKDLQLSNWYDRNIIFSIDFQYKEDNINVDISSSLGLSGLIVCEKVLVEIGVSGNFNNA